jgi:S-adenosylmethionine:tRNA ribosyltransferase-isomerase
VQETFVTLHVSAGTFQPVKTENALEHTMHNEQLVVRKETIQMLLSHRGTIIPVGTTAMRTLESLYWMGVNILEDTAEPFFISQHMPYEQKSTYSKQEAIQALLTYLRQEQVEELIGHTSIYIHPGYQFRVCDALLTNFHQPGSTLILLVAAFVGKDWERIYEEALKNNYRFLSYGDSSLLWKK